MRVETAARLLEAAGVRWVRFEIADTHGIARSKTVALARFAHDAARGIGCYGGILLQDPRGDDVPLPPAPRPDYLLRPDLDTLAVLPYAPGEARVICDVWRADCSREGADALRALLDDDFVRTYIAVKRNDVARTRAGCPDYRSDAWRCRVDDWERREYGELI